MQTAQGTAAPLCLVIAGRAITTCMDVGDVLGKLSVQTVSLNCILDNCIELQKPPTNPSDSIGKLYC